MLNLGATKSQIVLVIMFCVPSSGEVGSLCDWKDSCRISGGHCYISSFGISVCMCGATVKEGRYHLVYGNLCYLWLMQQ